MIILSIK